MGLTLKKRSVADPGFPRRRTPIREIGAKTYYLALFCRKLNENERNWTAEGGGENASLAPPWIRQWRWPSWPSCILISGMSRTHCDKKDNEFIKRWNTGCGTQDAGRAAGVLMVLLPPRVPEAFLLNYLLPRKLVAIRSVYCHKCLNVPSWRVTYTWD